MLNIHGASIQLRMEEGPLEMELSWGLEER